MFVGRSRFALMLASVLGVAAGLGACGGGGDTTGTNTTKPANLSIVSGNGQVGLVGTALSAPLTVKVTNSSGAALAGVAVQFSVVSGAATVSPGTATTDASGQAKTTV